VDVQSLVDMDGNEVIISGLSTRGNTRSKLGWLGLKAENGIGVCLSLVGQQLSPTSS